MPQPIRDLSDQRFGCLEPLRVLGRASSGNVIWQCKCHACGSITNVRSNDLTRRGGGGTISCGCQRSERKKTHGLSRTPEYSVWRRMVLRCHDPLDLNYPGYGGRGITVCDEWRASFEIFLRDIGNRPGSNLSLERKDNDGPYAPWNCIWATREAQSRNRRSNNMFIVKGNRICATDLAKQLDLSVTTLVSKVRKLGLESVLKMGRITAVPGGDTWKCES